jgi:hypothetical protein
MENLNIGEAPYVMTTRAQMEVDAAKALAGLAVATLNINQRMTITTEGLSDEDVDSIARVHDRDVHEGEAIYPYKYVTLKPSERILLKFMSI